jgi:hypothetical protein
MSLDDERPEARVHRKVAAIFSRLAGANLGAIDPGRVARFEHVVRAMVGGGDLDERAARDVAFHLTDWTAEAAFLVAVQLFPDAFTAEEIEAGVTALLIHAPNHLAAAAKLAGWPVRDVFGVGPLQEVGE